MKKYFFLLSVLLILNKMTTAQCDQVTISSIPTGQQGVQLCGSEPCETGPQIWLPGGGHLSLPAGANVPPTNLDVDAEDPTQVVLTFPNTGGNTINFPIVTGFVIQRRSSGITVTYPATVRGITISTNMMVDITINGTKNNSGNSMTPTSKSFSIPKGANISIRKSTATNKIEIIVSGQQLVYNPAVRSAIKNKAD